MADVWTLLQRRRRDGGGSPVVTFVDGAADVRTELSATSLENAAAKIANALRDEYGLEPGSTVGLALPVHWQRSAWCAGIWTAGCVVDVAPGAPVDLLVTALDPDGMPLSRGTGEIAVVSLHPFGLPISDPLPDGVVDVTLTVRQQPDAYLFEPPVAGMPALRSGGRTLSQAEVLECAAALADEWGLGSGGRLLAVELIDPRDSCLAALAVPLVRSASVVLAHGVTDLDRLADQERVTARAGSVG
jgi:uncharacterized protein (TIGR03089 family)